MIMNQMNNLKPEFDKNTLSYDKAIASRREIAWMFEQSFNGTIEFKN